MAKKLSTNNGKFDQWWKINIIKFIQFLFNASPPLAFFGRPGFRFFSINSAVTSGGYSTRRLRTINMTLCLQAFPRHPTKQLHLRNPECSIY
jgi:hypothetical protein